MDNLVYHFICHFRPPELIKKQREIYDCLLPRLKKNQTIMILSSSPVISQEIGQIWAVISWPGAGKIKGLDTEKAIFDEWKKQNEGNQDMFIPDQGK